MKYLIISQYFWPENFKINEIVSELSHHNSVDVITSYPNYPNGKIFEKFKNNRKKYDNFSGTKIYRVPQISRGDGSKIRILINYLSFLLSLTILSPKFFFKNYDRIFVFASSPVLVGFVGIIIAKFNNAKSYIWILDLWPEILVELKIIKSSLVFNFLNFVINLMYKKFDIILVQSKSFKNIIERKIKNKKKIIYFPSWSDDINFKKKKFKKYNSKFNILFTGNIGTAQNLEITIEATKMLIKNKIKNFKWIMVGDGRYKTTLINLVKNNQLNKYYSFHKHQKLSNLKNFYKKANICFISLKEGNVLNSTIPAKLQTYMSMGMPIIGSISGETSDLIRESKCGLVSSPGNKLKLFKNIKKILGMNISQLKMMGENGNKYSYNNFNKKIILNKLIFSLN
jgi:colanic acid biosynthesis glycosyl transferase WcaI